MADPINLPSLPIPAPIRETCSSIFSRWFSKLTGGTTSIRGAILSLCAIIALLTIMGQALHLSDPRAMDPQDGRNYASPSLPPQAAPITPPPYADGTPLLPPNLPRPPVAPAPTPPPESWWQRRLPLATELQIGQWELVGLVILCAVLPLLTLARRNYARWQSGHLRAPARSGGSSSSSSSTRHVPSPGGSPVGNAGAPRGGGRRGASRLMEEGPPLTGAL